MFPHAVKVVLILISLTFGLSDSEEGVCRLRKNDLCDVMQCKDVNGKLYISTSQATSGSVCFFRCEKELFSTWKKCLNGQWKIYKRNGTRLETQAVVRRVKRGFWSAIGNFFKCVFTLGFLCGGRSKRDTTPPSLHCPPDKWTLSDDLQTSAVVSWSEPTARDDRDGKVRVHRNGLGPGLPFSEGTTVIGYYARDNSGNMARCSFRITVKVPRCGNLPSLADGYYICHVSSDMVKGTVCEFGCYAGHKLEGASTTRCTESGTWTNSVPRCKRRKCEPPLIGRGELTVTCSDRNFYRSTCSYTCAEGFDVKPGMTRVRVCTKDGLWRGSEPKCVDITRPIITNCTRTVYGFADRGRTSGTPHWIEPSVFDNADRTIRLQRTGPGSTERLQAGTYDVTYTAIDNTGNEAVPCRMKVVVKVLRCPSIYNLPHQTVECPDGYKYGSQCNFRCANGSLINGTDVAVCEKESTGQYVSWRWGDFQPFCEVVQLCEDDLRPPDNGAVACDYWLGGKFCQMLCRTGYDIPPGYLYSDMYVCGESGTWLPRSDLPNCAKSYGSHTSALRMGVNYYFDGDCTEASVIEEIKVKFIQALKNSDFKDACEVFAEKCKPGNVQVYCGQQSAKRSANLNVQFDMEITVTSPFGNTTFGRLNEKIKILMNTVDNETFTIQNLETGSVIVFQDLRYDRLRIICDGRRVPSYVTESCVECPSGTYYNTETKSCLMCAIGEYKSTTNTQSCVKCPIGQTTRRQGATSVEECEDACPLGSFSSDGLPPCTPCSVGTYTDRYGSQSCVVCPVSSTTSVEGTNRLEDCKNFDIVLSTDSRRIILPMKNVTKDTDVDSGLTLSLRLKFQQIPTGSIVRIDFPNISIDVSIWNDTITLKGRDVQFAANLTLDLTLWHSLVVSINGSDVQSYIDGNKINLQNNPSNQTDGDFGELQEQNVAITVGHFIGTFAHLNVWSGDNSLDDIIDDVSLCNVTRQGDLLGWKEFEDVDEEDVFIQIPSQCDDYDNCVAETCNGGLCTDGLHSYHCDCPIGLKGDNCEINTDDCVDHSCENNSTCVDGVGGYSCHCRTDVKGELCEIQIVDGSWSVWSNWSECSSTCGNGTATRKRLCNSPTPDNGGQECVGDAIEITDCNLMDCAVCTNLTTSDNSTLDCKWNATEDAITCTLQCNHGYDFDHAVKESYHCGPDTFHLWDFQTDDNPYGRLPACTKIEDGTEIDWNYMASYEDLECKEGNFELVTKKIKTVVYETSESLSCQMAGTCSLVNIDVTDCQPNRRRRSTSTDENTAGFSARFTCDAAKHTSDGCKDIIISSLEEIVIKIRGNSFNTIIDEVEYFIKPNSSAFGGKVVCHPGTVPVSHYCVPCSQGRHQHGDDCVKCPVGTYQDTVGQTACVGCPEGSTTEGRASVDVADCSLTLAEPSDNSVPVWQYAGPIVIGVLVMIGIVFFALIKYLRQRPSYNIQKLEVKSDNSNAPGHTMHELVDCSNAPGHSEHELDDYSNAPANLEHELDEIQLIKS